LKKGEDHESLWSWELFWHQFKAFWRSLWARIFPQKNPATAGDAVLVEDLRSAPSGIRTIREIYRAFLKRTATLGHARSRFETPHEFQQRLHTILPPAEPYLGTLTEAYAATRYSGHQLDSADVENARLAWGELERRLNPPTPRP
jgi:hypothetical protein